MSRQTRTRGNIHNGRMRGGPPHQELELIRRAEMIMQKPEHPIVRMRWNIDADQLAEWATRSGYWRKAFYFYLHLRNFRVDWLTERQASWLEIIAVQLKDPTKAPAPARRWTAEEIAAENKKRS